MPMPKFLSFNDIYEPNSNDETISFNETSNNSGKSTVNRQAESPNLVKKNSTNIYGTQVNKKDAHSLTGLLSIERDPLAQMNGYSPSLINSSEHSAAVEPEQLSLSYKGFYNPNNKTTLYRPSNYLEPNSKISENNPSNPRTLSTPTYSSSLMSLTSPTDSTESKTNESKKQSQTTAPSSLRVNRKQITNIRDKNNRYLGKLDDGMSTLRRNSYTRAIFSENA
jgi:hypothetical protein